MMKRENDELAYTPDEVITGHDKVEPEEPKMVEEEDTHEESHEEGHEDEEHEEDNQEEQEEKEESPKNLVGIDEYLQTRGDIRTEVKAGFKVYMKGRGYQYSRKAFEDALDEYFNRDYNGGV